MKRRIRQHINPLSFLGEPERPDWSAVFPEPDWPLEVDIGFGKGAFLLGRAAQSPRVNLVGLEIRRPMVERLAERIARAGWSNVHVICCNANVSLVQFFEPGSVTRVYVHFPDPWFKKRHHKRRLINARFLTDLARVLVAGGEFHFATDYLSYAEEVLALLAERDDFEDGGEVGPPFGVSTDRERWHRDCGDPILRRLFRRAPEGGVP